MGTQVINSPSGLALQDSARIAISATGCPWQGALYSAGKGGQELRTGSGAVWNGPTGLRTGYTHAAGATS